jgi:hypothetical protein
MGLNGFYRLSHFAIGGIILGIGWKLEDGRPKMLIDLKMGEFEDLKINPITPLNHCTSTTQHHSNTLHSITKHKYIELTLFKSNLFH